MLRFTQIEVVGEQPFSSAARPTQRFEVVETRETPTAPSALNLRQVPARTPKLQILLRQIEPVQTLYQRLQPSLRDLSPPRPKPRCTFQDAGLDPLARVSGAVATSRNGPPS